MTTGYVRESDSMQNSPGPMRKSRKNDWNTIPTPSFDTVKEAAKISHEKLPTMPEKSAFKFHHIFYPKLKINLQHAQIS